MMDWCADFYRSEGLPTAGQRVLPTEDDSGASSRVLRGGSWRYTASDLRAASRFRHAPSRRSSYLGFRLARSSLDP